MRLVAYEAQQAVGQAEMKSEVKDQVSEVTDGLKQLYNTANVAVRTVAAPVDKLEEKIRGGAIQGQKSLLHRKNMTVSVLEKMDQWRSWTADVEDYTEEAMPGIRSYLDKAKSEEEEISEVDLDPEACAQRDEMAISQALHCRRSPRLEEVAFAIRACPCDEGCGGDGDFYQYGISPRQDAWRDESAFG